MSVAGNIKRLRIQNNMTQEELAEKMFVSRQTVSSWETGRNQPDVDTLKALASVYGNDINELIYGVPKGAYPRYQKKYCIVIAVCVAIIILMLLLRSVLVPYLLSLWNDIHWEGRYRYSGYWYYAIPLLSQAGIGLSLGVTVLSVFSLWLECRIRNTRYFFITGIILLLPVFLIVAEYLIETIVFSPDTPNQIRIASLVYVNHKWLRWPLFSLLPFISGCLFFLRRNGKT